tara:strand:+ start:1507 stop:1929 length:423 start_codon:yes stop_codon:yes gene_type:complete
MEYVMKKTIVILTVFALSVLWGQKEISANDGDGEATINEKINANQVKSIDPEMIQQIRAFKAMKEKMHIKKEMMNGIPSGPKSFKVSNSESKFLAIKKIIEAIKSDKSELMIKGKIDINASGLKNENEGTNLLFKNNSGK